MSETTASSRFLSSSQVGCRWNSGNDVLCLQSTYKGKDCCLFLREFKSQHTSVNTQIIHSSPGSCASSHLTIHDQTLQVCLLLPLRGYCCFPFPPKVWSMNADNWKSTNKPSYSNTPTCRKNGSHATTAAEINRTSQEADMLSPVASKTLSMFEFSKTRKPTGKINLHGHNASTKS